MFNARDQLTYAMRHSWREGNTPEEIVGYGQRVTIKQEDNAYKVRVERENDPDVPSTERFGTWPEVLAYLGGLRDAYMALMAKTVKL